MFKLSINADRCRVCKSSKRILVIKGTVFSNDTGEYLLKNSVDRNKEYDPKDYVFNDNYNTNFLCVDCLIDLVV